MIVITNCPVPICRAENSVAIVAEVEDVPDGICVTYTLPKPCAKCGKKPDDYLGRAELNGIIISAYLKEQG